jgi:hypothetical protein
MGYDDEKSDTTSRISGVPKRENRAEPLANRTTRTAEDATGINVADRRPISDTMPWLPPA